MSGSKDGEFVLAKRKLVTDLYNDTDDGLDLHNPYDLEDEDVPPKCKAPSRKAAGGMPSLDLNMPPKEPDGTDPAPTSTKAPVKGLDTNVPSHGVKGPMKQHDDTVPAMLEAKMPMK